MREGNKTIYKIGGTNGVVKSAWHKEIIKEDIPYINAGFVAKEIAGGKEPTQRQYQLAQEFCTAQIKNLLASNRSFAFENNMHEESNYQWLTDIQQMESYRIELYYIGVADLRITTARIQERLKSGDHYCLPIRSGNSGREGCNSWRNNMICRHHRSGMEKKNGPSALFCA